MHWPALLVWHVAGVLGHYLAIRLSGTVGAYTSIGGFLLLPFAALSQLIAFVAMFMVVRDGLRNLQAIAPQPEEAAERRRTFLNSILTGILPFFAVYTGAGYFNDDITAYNMRALEVNSAVGWVTLGDGSGPPPNEDFGNQISFSFLPILIIVLAFAARIAWKKWGGGLPRWMVIFAVYLECVWVAFSLYFIQIGLNTLTWWVDNRAAKVWLDGIGEWFATTLTPVAWLWEGANWLIGEIVSIIAQPLAWLAIAAVLYGRAISVESPNVTSRTLSRVREGWSRLPDPLERRLNDIGREFTGRFAPIVKAFSLMWHAGPVLIATYVLLYALALALEPALQLLTTRLVGPQDFATFWKVADLSLFLIAPAIVEPIRVAIIAGSYDATLGTVEAVRTTEVTPVDVAETPTESDALASSAGDANGEVNQKSTSKRRNLRSSP